MELFNEYYNSEVQFLLTLFSFNRPFSEGEAIAAVKDTYVYVPYSNYTNVIEKWIKQGLIEKINDKYYQVNYNFHLNSFAAPLNSLESEFLSDIYDTKEAELFLGQGLNAFSSSPKGSMFDCIKHQNSLGKQTESENINQIVFRKIMSAIYEKQYIEYEYITNTDPTVQKSISIPYRLEYSVFDGRWWLISYNEEQDRTIKSRLENIKAVKPGKKHNIAEDTIHSAILRHIAATPVKLHIADEKKALERCFLCFEDMLDMTAYKLNEKEYELRFKYFDWDQHIIVKKLLYLGENVVVKSPDIIIKELVAELKACQKRIPDRSINLTD